MPRAEVAAALKNLLSLEGIEVSRADIMLPLLERYAAGADLGDVIHLASAAKCDGFATFDRRLARAAGGDEPVPILTLA
jgi:predicted nucleic-acid-binding protein